jgi:hypothetical protein
MNQHDNQQFLKLYQAYRYNDQLNWYRNRQGEFTKAQTQAIIISIVLIFLAGIAGIFSAVDLLWFKLVCLLGVAIFPVFSTMVAAYSALYAFEQQAKLYQDTINNLLQANADSPDLKQGLSEADFAQELGKFVLEVENIFLVEQGQWGQLAKQMKPPEA